MEMMFKHKFILKTQLEEELSKSDLEHSLNERNDYTYYIIELISNCDKEEDFLKVFPKYSHELILSILNLSIKGSIKSNIKIQKDLEDKHPKGAEILKELMMLRILE